MKKIPTLFLRDPATKFRTLTTDVHSACGWVLNGEGLATRKFDGSCVLVRDGQFLKRREVKKGKPLPTDFELEDFDEETGKSVGWVPVTDGSEDKWFRVAMENTGPVPNGTYEACGPHFQGNPEGFDRDLLVRHGSKLLHDVPRSYLGLQAWLITTRYEGIVWHHPDGRMAKIKRRDFGG